ncbi:MAG: acetylglutamate kinase [Gammaproteobacteria bacterium]|nr:acetylglutamate kinase [Gammaproteobacteria bacterium]
MLILKVGGGAAINLEGIATDLAALDAPAVVVLGANAVRDELAERLGTPKQVLTSISGYASVFSDAQAIDIIMMSYAGLRSRRFVELCQQHGVNAVGLCGLDGRVVQGERNKGIRVREGGKTLLKRDFSGKPRAANGTLLRWLLDGGYVPVITIPIADERGCAINSENDDIVNVLQDELRAERIVQLIEAPGFLDDANDPASVLSLLTRADLELREQRLEGRIKRKLLALRRLLEAGAGEVIIADGRGEHPVRDALDGRGTRIG